MAAELSTAPVEVGWLGGRPRPVLLAFLGTGTALVVGVTAARDLTMALGLLAAIALVVAVLLRPLVGAVVLVAVVPVTSGLAPGYPLPHLRISEVLIGLVGLTVMASTRRRYAVRWQLLDWALLVYGLGWTALGVAAALSGHQHLSVADWGTVVGQLQFFLLYRGIRLGIQTAEDRRLSVGVLVACSVPVSLLAILQEVRAPGVGNLVSTMTGGLAASGTAASAGALVRATGPFDNWAALAGYLLPILLLLVAAAIGGVPVAHRRWFIGIGLLGTVALVCTAEQSVVVCLVVGVLVLATRYGSGRYRRVVRWGTAGFAVLAAALLASRIATELAATPGTGRVGWVPQTLSFRWSIWTTQYFPAIGRHLLAGYGVIQPPSIRWPYPESQYVAFLIEGGVIMLALFGLLAWAMLRASGEARRSPDALVQAAGWALMIATVALLVMNLTWPFLSNGGMPQVLWCLMAIAMSGAVGRVSRSAGTGATPGAATVGATTIGDRGAFRHAAGLPERVAPRAVPARLGGIFP